MRIGSCLLLLSLALGATASAAPIHLRDTAGRPWLREAEFGARLVDGTELRSAHRRYALERSGTPDRAEYAFTDGEGVLDLRATVVAAGPSAVRVRLALTNRSAGDLRLDRVIVLSGLRVGEGRFGRCLPNGLHSWENPEPFPILPGQSYDQSYWTVAVEAPALAAGFVTGLHNVDRFSIKTEDNALRVTAWGECDGCLLPPGATRESDELFLSAAPEPLAELERYADLAAEANGATPRFDNFATWCSWYAGWIRGGMYGVKGGLERGVEREIPLVGRAFAARGAGWMRIVDDTDEMPYGDWDDQTKALPLGFSHLVTRMRAEGVEPGIWLPLLMVSDRSRLFARHPDWLCGDGQGNPAVGEFYGNQCGLLDPSHPRVQAHLERLGRSLRERGFRYVMTDFLINGFGPPAHADPTMTKLERHRAGLEAFRRGLGPDVYWLGCGAVLGPSMGLCDGLRISGDSFGNAPYSYIQSGTRWFLNHRVWLNDPDAIVCRGHSTEWNRAWMTWMALSGQVLTYGDTLEDLAPEDLATYQRVFPPVGVAGRPLDLWENQPYLLWGLKPDARTRLFGVFHFTEAGADEEVRLNLDEIAARIDSWTERPATAPRRWLLWDFWNEGLTEVEGPTLELPLPSGGGRLFALREALDRPQLLATSGHFTMGALEVRDESWDPRARTLSLRVRGNGGDPTTVYVRVPLGWGLVEATVDGRAVTTGSGGEGVAAVTVAATARPLPVALRFDGGPARTEGRRPFEGGNPALWDPSAPRRRALESATEPGWRLAAYLDCPAAQSVGDRGPTLAVLRGKPFTFPASGGAAPWYRSIAFHEESIRLEVRGLRPGRRYRLGLSWWDEDANGRVESVTVVAADGRRFPLLEKAVLPGFRGKGQMPEERLLEVPAEAVVPGPIEVIVSNDANVPNAVIGEVWILEGDE